MPGKNVVLIGFMGTGKSSVGKLLAKYLKREALDLDHLIEAQEKKKIASIFSEKGEAYFRLIEKKIVQKACQNMNSVIITGGGVVLDEENWADLKAAGLVIALDASPRSIFNRVRHSSHRPLLKKEGLYEEIVKLLKQRKPYYKRADIIFHTDGKTPAQVASLLLKKIVDKMGKNS